MLGPTAALRLFGAQAVAVPTADVPDDVAVLALAARAYRGPQAGAPAALLGEHPCPVRVKLGAAITRDGEGRPRLVWRVGHHERTQGGRSWRRISLSEHASAEVALISYFAEPSRLARPMPPMVERAEPDAPGRPPMSARKQRAA